MTFFTPEVNAAIIALVIAILTALTTWIKGGITSTIKQKEEEVKHSVDGVNENLIKLVENTDSLKSIKESLQNIARDLHDMAVQGRLFNPPPKS